MFSQLIDILCIVFARTLGNNNFPCDCSIAWLWKDYKGRIQILPRNLIGFHKRVRHFAPLRCYKESQGQKTWHSFNEIDLEHCHIEGTIDQGAQISKILTVPANIYLFKINYRNTRKWCFFC